MWMLCEDLEIFPRSSSWWDQKGALLKILVEKGFPGDLVVPLLELQVKLGWGEKERFRKILL
jgi:hypothetical protein